MLSYSTLIYSLSHLLVVDSFQVEIINAPLHKKKKSSHLFSRRNQINNSVTHIVQHNAHKDVKRNAKEVHYGAS